MRHARFLALILMILLAGAVAATAAEDTPPDSLTRVTESWTGDLPRLLKEERPVRVLVSYDRTNFFLVMGAMRGLEYDLMRTYEKHLAAANKGRAVRMTFVAVPFDQLIPALLDGQGDVVAAGMTVTKKRSGRVLFSAPYRSDVREVVVGSRRAKPIRSTGDLAGAKVYVMAGSSYRVRLESVSAELKKRGMKPVKVVPADANLMTEDLLEMAQRGMIDYLVADEHIARVWAKVLPDIRIYDDVPLHTGGRLAWAVRPDCPKLAKSLSAFAATVRQGTLMGNMVFKRYFENSRWLMNPLESKERGKLDTMAVLFKKYGKEYDLDWLKLAAMAYQESGLDMHRRSAAGAVGVMQVRPSTAADPNIGVADIDTLDGNIHAGTKYLRYLRDNYFSDAARDAQVDFALAAYNAGPARINGLRKKAVTMGLDPNRWFGNVEWAAYREIGTETPTYVANVQMYYAAYKSVFEVVSERLSAQ
jgi:membrane-bound lytic murein transglycosylase MltF